MKKRPSKSKAKSKYKPSKDRLRLPPGISSNGVKIWKCMLAAKVKGNYKDFVLFVGDQMLDRYGTYTVQRPDAGPDQQVMLLHKSKLATVAGHMVGALFWDAKWKRRTNHGHAEYNAPRQARSES